MATINNNKQIIAEQAINKQKFFIKRKDLTKNKLLKFAIQNNRRIKNLLIVNNMIQEFELLGNTPSSKVPSNPTIPQGFLNDPIGVKALAEVLKDTKVKFGLDDESIGKVKNMFMSTTEDMQIKENFSGLVDTFTSKLIGGTEVGTFLNNVNNASDAVVYYHDKIINGINMAADFVKDNKNTILAIIFLLVSIIALNKRWISMNLFLKLAAMFGGLWFGFDIYKILFKHGAPPIELKYYMNKYMPNMYFPKCKEGCDCGIHDVAAQGLEDTTVLNPSLFTHIAGIFIAGTVFKNMDTSCWMESIIKLTKDFKRQKEGLTEFVKFGTDTIVDIINTVSEMCGFTKYLKIKSHGTAEVWSWVENVTELKKKFNEENRFVNFDYAVKLRMIYQEGELLLNKHCKAGDDMYKLVQYHLGTIKPMIEVLRGMHVDDSGFRPEPLSIIMGGNPGVGKSSIFPTLCAEIALRIAPLDEIEKYIKDPTKLYYNRVSEQEFWDGYKGQLVCLFDDFGQLIDQVGMANSVYWEFIRAINTVPWNLHMANLSDKGNTPFCSRVVIGTTNCIKFEKDAEIKSIMTAGALTRRIKVGLWCTVTKEFALNNESNPSLRKLDPAKMWNRAFDSTFKHMEFFNHDYSTGVTIWEAPMTYKQVLEFCVKTYNKGDVYFGESINDLGDLVKKVIAERRNCNIIPQGINDNQRIRHRLKLKKKTLSEEYVAFYDAQEGLGENHSFQKMIDEICSLRNINGLRKYQLYESIREISFIMVNEEGTLFNVDSIKKYDLSFLNEDHPELDMNEFENLINIKADQLFTSINSFVKEETTSNKLYNKLQGSFNAIKGILLNKQKVLGMASLILTGVTLWHALSGKESKVPQSSSGLKVAAKNSKSKSRNVITQHGDPAGSAIINSIINKNLINVSVLVDGIRKNMGALLAVYSNVLIGPAHFVDQCLNTEVTQVFLKPISTFGTDYEIILTPDQFAEMLFVMEGEEKVDFGYYILSKEFYPKVFRDIRKFLTPSNYIESKLKDNMKVQCELTTFINNDKILTTKIQTVNARYRSKEMAPTKRSVDEEVLNLLTSYEYDCINGPGYCGSILSIVDKSSKNYKVLGLHVLGNSATGWSYPIVAEKIEKDINLLLKSRVVAEPLFEKEESSPLLVDAQGTPVVNMNGFEILGTIREIEHVPSESSIIESPCKEVLENLLDYKFDKIVPNMRQDYLGNKDVLEISRFKYNAPIVPYDQDLLDEINEEFFSHVIDSQETFERSKVFDFETAVKGIEGDDGFNPISKNTSPGWPWKHKGFKGSKKEMFGQEEWDFTLKGSQMVKERVNQMLIMYKNNMRPFCVAKDFPKDERRPINKSLRLVSGYEVSYSIIFRMYFGDFMRMIHRGRLRHGICVGINAYGEDWTLNFERHQKFERTLFGDFSRWDGNMSRQLMNTFLKAANLYYNDENSILREQIFEEITNSKHIWKNTIYSLFGGMGSGNPATAVINSWVHSVLIRYIICEISRDKGLSRPHFKEELATSVYGDDEVVSMSSTIDIYPIDFQRMYKKFGWTFTDELKSDDIGDWRKLEEGSFLKRGFHFHKSLKRLSAPIAIATILEMSCFTKKKDNNFEYVKGNIEKAFMELSLHDEETFEKYKPILMKMGMSINYFPESVNYKRLAQRASLLDMASSVVG